MRWGAGDRTGGWGELVTPWYVGKLRVGPGSSGSESFIRWFGAVQVEGCGLGGLARFLWFLSVLCSSRVSIVLSSGGFVNSHGVPLQVPAKRRHSPELDLMYRFR